MPRRTALIPGGRLLAALLLLGLAPVRGDSPAEPAPRAPGKLYDLGGYRLHALVTGKGGPPVVLLSGMGDPGLVWSLVQPQVAKFARVLSYDRAGDGWSDLGPVPRTIRQEAHELHLLLSKAGLKPPCVLVGASYGGLIARQYAADFPGEVAGMVFVDATHEDTILSMGQPVNGRFQARLVRIRETATGRAVPPPQTMASSPPKPPSDADRRGWEEFAKQMGPPKIESPHDRLPVAAQRALLWLRAHPKLSGPSENYMAEEFQQFYTASRKEPHPLGRMPLISLRAGTGETFVPETELLATMNLTPAEWTRQAGQRAADLATLSSDSRWYVAKDSGHEIHLFDPGLVTFAIQRVVEAVRTRTPVNGGRLLTCSRPVSYGFRCS
jgi:pimeloyl-ACP methyl ester carboxylesterase